MVPGEPLNLFQKARKKVGADYVALGGYMGGLVPLKGFILGLYRDNGKENGSYYLGFRV